MKTKTLKVISTIFGVLIAGILVYLIVVKVKNQRTESSVFSESADSLLTPFIGSERNANQPYLQKVMQVYARISEVRMSRSSDVKITPIRDCHGAYLLPV